MKKLCPVMLMLFLLASLTTYPQTIRYTYDEAGNRTRRAIILEGGGKGSAGEKSKKDEIKEIITDNSFKPQTVRIYPNPTKGVLAIEVQEDPEGSSEMQIIVTDSNGRIIINKTKEPLITTVDLSNQPGGLYILTMKRGTITSKWKIIKR